MADKLMHIPNDDAKNTPSVDYNQWTCNEPTNQNSIKVHKLVEKNNMKTLL